MQQPGQAIVSFDAARLGVKSVRFVALPGEFLLDRPGPRPHRRIFDRDDVFKRGWAGPRPALAQMQGFACPLIIGLWTEVRHIDDKSITVPVAARIANPLAE